MGFENTRKTTKELREAIIHDCNVLWAFNAGKKVAGLKPSFLYSDKYKRTNRLKPRKNKFCPLSKRYLLYSWGVGVNFENQSYGFKYEQSLTSPTQIGKEEEKKSTSNSVIENHEAAKKFYTPRFFYIQNFIREHVRKEKNSLMHYDYKDRQTRLKLKAIQSWNQMTIGRKPWDALSREQLARQPYIRDEILGHFQMNPALSFEQCSNEIGNWCSASTIHAWLQSHSDYCTYVERVLPLLSTAQKAKHVKFAKQPKLKPTV